MNMNIQIKFLAVSRERQFQDLKDTMHDKRFLHEIYSHMERYSIFLKSQFVGELMVKNKIIV